MAEKQTDTLLDTILETEQAKQQADFVPSVVLKALFSEINEREQEVIARRYGLSGKKKETLESIGSSFSVTRERVRQIENAALRHLRQSDAFKNISQKMVKSIGQVISVHGGIMEENHLISELLSHLSETSPEDAHVLFFLKALETDDIVEVKENDTFNSSWRLSHSETAFPEQHISELASLFTNTKSPLTHEDITAQLQEQAFYSTHKDKLNPTVILAHLNLGKQFNKNPFEQWGLVTWKTITPKRMGDKIFLVLQQYEKPLHYREITEKINEYGFDHKKAHAPTVHNELILDDRYVLVGRGMYALKEWGFEPGVVSDVIDRVLDENGVALTRDEIIDRVLKKRFVKRGTIYLALTDKNRFQRTKDGKYSKKEKTAQTV